MTSILNSCLTLPPYSPTYPSTTRSNSSSSPSRTLVQSPIQSFIKPLQEPSDDCGAVQPQYIAASSSQELLRNEPKVFDVYCKTEALDGDFMSFYSPSLITCIDGCAAYNTWQITNSLPRTLNCSSVRYSLRIGIWGNCFLKQAGNILRMSESAVATYAKLRASWWYTNSVIYITSSRNWHKFCSICNLQFRWGGICNIQFQRKPAKKIFMNC